MTERTTEREQNPSSASPLDASPASAPLREPSWGRAVSAIQSIDVFNVECGAHQVIARLGNKWTLLVMYSLVQGTKRYTELQRQIKGISPKMLTQVLRNLENDQLVCRKVHPVVPPMVEYSFTPLGKSIAEPLVELCIWAEEHDKMLRAAWQLK